MNAVTGEPWALQGRYEHFELLPIPTSYLRFCISKLSTHLKWRQFKPHSFQHTKVFISLFIGVLCLKLSFVEILRAAKILRSMALAHVSEKGAVGLEGEMIDAPMLKQVRMRSIAGHS